MDARRSMRVRENTPLRTPHAPRLRVYQTGSRGGAEMGSAEAGALCDTADPDKGQCI